MAERYTYEHSSIALLPPGLAKAVRGATIEQSGVVPHAYRIHIDGHAEAAYALYCHEISRVGIAWGAEADWLDAPNGIDAAIAEWMETVPASA